MILDFIWIYFFVAISASARQSQAWCKVWGSQHIWRRHKIVPCVDTWTSSEWIRLLLETVSSLMWSDWLVLLSKPEVFWFMEWNLRCNLCRNLCIKYYICTTRDDSACKSTGMDLNIRLMLLWKFGPWNLIVTI